MTNEADTKFKIPMWHQGHHNAIAKEIRELLQHFLIEKRTGATSDIAASTALTMLADDLAHRFKEDNPHFDPCKWLDQCSPDVELYPLSVLWTGD